MTKMNLDDIIDAERDYKFSLFDPSLKNPSELEEGPQVFQPSSEN